MSKRNLIEEIREKNERAESRFLHGHIELYSIESSAKQLTESDHTLRALHLMGIAACIEVSVREAMKRLIDSGAPYLDRVEGFKEHMRFDFALTKALNTGQITFGDLVAHSLPVSNIGHIASHMEMLYANGAKKFPSILAGIREFVEPDVMSEHDEAANPSPRQLIEDPQRLCEDIASIFTLRHLVAHEASFQIVTIDVFVGLLESAREFVNAMYELVEQTIFPGRSRNGHGLSFQHMKAAQEVVNSAAALSALVRERLERNQPENKEVLEAFDKVTVAFEQYHHAEESFIFAFQQPFSGNAMRNMDASLSQSLYSHRLQRLRELDEATKPF